MSAEGPEELVFPASFSQKRLWFLEQYAPGGNAYNVPVAFRARGEFDERAWRAALNDLVTRHEILRTRIEPDGDDVVQIVSDEATLEIVTEDLRGASDPRAAALGFAETLAQRSFRLDQAPLFRVGVAREADDAWTLVLSFHHAICDGWSLALLSRELWTLYAAQVIGADAGLPEHELAFLDFSEWQREWMATPECARELAYWKSALAPTLPVLELHPDRTRSKDASPAGATLHFSLGEALSGSIDALARGLETTPFVVLLSAYAILLCSEAGQEEIVIGSVIAGRTRSEFEHIVGFFANTLALRVQAPRRATFAEVVRSVRERVLDAQSNQTTPFDRVVEELEVERATSHMPVFQTLFVLDNQESLDAHPPGLQLEPVIIESGEVPYDIMVSLAKIGARYDVHFRYASNVFDASRMRRLGERFRTVLERATTSRSARVAELDRVTAEQRSVLEAASRGPVLAPANDTVVERLLRAASAHAALPAISWRDTTWTYAELFARANAVAHRLRAESIGRDDRVGIVVDQRPEVIAAILGVVLAGGAYVPLDPGAPAERRAFMVADSGCRHVLGFAERRGASPSYIELDHLAAPEGPIVPPVAVHRRDSLVYVIYTSGSTGMPKGVAIEHHSLVGHLDSIAGTFELGPGEVCLQFCSLAFDVSVEDLFLTLTTGAKLALRTPEMTASAPAFCSALDAYGVTAFTLATPYFGELERGLVEENIGLPAAVRMVRIGGEAAPRDAVVRWLAAGRARFVNGYGPTETTIVVTEWCPAEDGPLVSVNVPIGSPLAGSQTLILDDDLELVHFGMAGELFIGGARVARGYLGRADLTAGRFVPHPTDAGQRLYRTGDLVRRREDGSIEFLRRRDRQIKLRGFRIELGEIEVALRAIPGVREASVLLVTARNGDNELRAFVAPPGLDVESARKKLLLTLPEYMVPTTYVPLDTLPLSTAGKVDRQKLAAIEIIEEVAADDAPRSPGEAKVALLFQELLALPRVPRQKSFFRLGGHSLLAARLVARLERTHGITLPLRQVFETPTVAGIAAALEARTGSEAGAPLVRVSRAELAHVSTVQRRLFFLDQLESGSAFYNIAVGVWIEGALDVPRLERALHLLVERHEGLRTQFVVLDGEPWQQVHDAPRTVWRHARCHAPTLDARRAQAESLAQDEASRGFDLRGGVSFRAALWEASERDFLLTLVFHHVISDGWSLRIALRDLVALYEAPDTALPELPFQYIDYAEWQSRTSDADAEQREIDYWRQTLQGIPHRLALPTDKPRPLRKRYLGKSLVRDFGHELGASMRRFAQDHERTPFLVALTALSAFLHRLTGDSDVVVGTPASRRVRVELEDVVGCFVNTIVLRTRPTPSQSFAELLASVAATSEDAYAHQDVAFEKMVDALAPERSQAHTPIFQVMIVYNAREPMAFGTLPARFIDLEAGTSTFDLTFTFDEGEDGLSLAIEYDTDLFEEATIAAWADAVGTLTSAALARPDTRLASLPLVHESARVELPDAPRGVFGEALGAPDDVAVRAGSAVLTYRDLDQRTARLASALAAEGVTAGDRVAVCLARDENLLPALRAILSLGAAYVPLDPAFPAERLEQMVADARPRAAVTTLGLESVLPRGIARVLVLEQIPRETKGNARTRAPLHATTPAYVLFTSGSTGRPKGVEVPVLAALQVLAGIQSHLHLSRSDVWLATTTLSFDISMLELFLPLQTGGSVAIFPRDAVLDPMALLEAIDRTSATVLQLTPSAWRLLLAAGFAGSKSLKHALTGGEAIAPGVAAQLAARVPVLWNVYGPTETTVWSSIARIKADVERITIGRALPGNLLYVVDSELRPVPTGVPGELAIGGLQVALGYVGDPAQTATRFMPDPFVAGSGARLYLTGDRARSLASGEVEWLGRVDAQIKHRGYRIELGEIDAAFSRVPGVAESATALHVEADGRTRLVGYVLGADPEAAVLRRAVEATLPPYMVPDALVRLESFPRTLNGKCDRKRLPWPTKGDPTWATATTSAGTEATLDSGGEDGATATDVETRVGRAYAQILGAEIALTSSLDLDFFRAGGDSLSVLRLVALLRRDGLEISIGEVAQLRTVRSVAQAARSITAPEATPSATNERSPLTGIQKGFLFLALGGDRTSYVEQCVFHSPTALRKADFERAFHQLMERLPSARAFVGDGPEGEPELVCGSIRTPLRWLTHAALDAPADVALDAIVGDELSASWDPRKPPLLRAVVLEGNSEAWLVLSFHHVVLDGWSADLVVEALCELYEGRAPEIVDIGASYAAWVTARPALSAAQLLATFGGALDDSLRLFGRGGERSPPSAPVTYLQKHRALDAAQSERVFAAAEALGVSPMALFAAAHASTIARLSGEDRGHVRFGTVFSGRSASLADVDIGVGMLANTLPVTVAIAHDDSLRARATAMQARLSELFLVEHTPLQSSFGSLGGSTRELPFESILVYAPRPDTRARATRVLEPLRDPLPRTGYPLHVGVQPSPRGFVVTWTSDTSRFGESEVDAIADQTMEYIAALVADPTRRASAESDEASVAEVWRTVNATAHTHELQRLEVTFADHAHAHPTRTALAMAGETVTYGELAAAALHVGARIRSLGKGDGTARIVALLFERSFEMLLAIYGVLEAGDAFLPLDTAAPQQRLTELVDDAAPIAILCDAANAELAHRVAGDRPVTVLGAADFTSSRDARVTSARALSTRAIHDLAYVLFTSGSTGKPKAAMLEHAGVANRLAWMQRAFPLDARDVVLQKTPYTFDVSMWELFWPLRVGARMAIAAPGAHYDPRNIAAAIEKEGVTVAHFVPAMLQAFIDVVDPQQVRSLRLLFASGEALSPSLARAVHDKLPWVALHNLYGPTEASIDVTWWPCPPAPTLVPIGRPIDNVRTYIADRDLRLVPPGVPGDLYLAGIQLARGYLHRPELTADRFLPDPFTATAGERMYRTGDRARLLSDGAIEFLGRSDFQVKLRGLRIELGEIEETLRGLAGVVDAIVDVRELGEPALVAWVRAATPVDVAALRDELRKRLPAYMIPQYFVEVTSWPTGRSGKVDRRALPLPDLASIGGTEARSPDLSALADLSALPALPPLPALSALETKVAALFAEVLGVRGAVDPRASFFDLGGHSMLALRLVSRAEREHGVRLELDALFADPTVRGFANAIVAARSTSLRGDDVLIPFAKGTSPDSVFWIHPVGGGVLGYRELVKASGGTFSHYGITSRAASARAARTLLDLVEIYGRAITAVAEGPIHLVGWSLGGVLAWELAEWLESKGKTVGAVIGIDSFARLPEGDATVETIELLANELRLPEATVAEAVLSGSFEALAAQLHGLAVTDLATLASDLGDNVRRMRAHLPTLRTRRMLLAEASIRSAGLEAPRETWAAVGAELEVIELDADHDSIVTGANAEHLGRRIDDEIHASTRR